MASTKSTGLGRGLDALFGEEEINAKAISAERSDNESTEDVVFVNINDIKPNANQPRKEFDEAKLKELAESIKAHGLIQPIVLRKAKKGYEIVAGERRWRASRKAKLKKIPCLVKELTDEENMLVAIIENMQREDLNPIEEAEGLNQMVATYGLTQEQVSKSVGKSRPYITNALRLLKLPEEVRKMVSLTDLSAGHARALLGVDDPQKILELAQKAVKEDLSVRTLEKLVKTKGGTASTPRRRADKNADVKKVEEDLKDVLGTKVTLRQEARGGKIEISYYTREELERLIELLKTLQ